MKVKDVNHETIVKKMRIVYVSLKEVDLIKKRVILKGQATQTTLF